MGLAIWLATLQAHSASGPTDTAEVRNLSIAWMDALERKDYAALEKMMAKDFTLGPLGGGTDSLVPRERWLHNATQRTFSDFEYRNLRVERAGDVALIFADLRFRASPMPFALDSAVMDEWVFRDGRWQVKARWLGESRSAQRLKLVGAFGGGVLLAWLLGWVRRRHARATR